MDQDKQLMKKDSELPATRAQQRRGTQDIDQEDKVIPRLKIMQALSPEVLKDRISEVGNLLNSLTKMDYGKLMTIVPVFWYKSRIYFRDRKDGGGILCRADDGKHGTVYGTCMDCIHSKWSKDSESQQSVAPKCTAIINIVALVLTQAPHLVCISFFKTSYNAGKQLINIMNYKNVDIFNYAYDIYTEQQTNDMGVFNVLRYKDTNRVVSDEVYKHASELYERFERQAPKVDDVDSQDPDTTPF
jgi:hypothetical protein